MAADVDDKMGSDAESSEMISESMKKTVGSEMELEMSSHIEPTKSTNSSAMTLLAHDADGAASNPYIRPTSYILVKQNADCNSEDTYLGKFDSVQECAEAVQKAKVTEFFVYGTGSNAGKCWYEHTTSPTCPNGWHTDSYDFYYIPRDYVLVKENHECNSRDTYLGKFDSVLQCALAVKAEGSYFFVYGYGAKAKQCYVEHASSRTCERGWEADSYDFYKRPQHAAVLGMECSFDAYYTHGLRTTDEGSSIGRITSSEVGKCKFMSSSIQAKARSLKTSATANCILSFYTDLNCIEGQLVTAVGYKESVSRWPWTNEGSIRYWSMMDLIDVGADLSLRSYKCECHE
jgi:hypothetical protein